MFAALAALGLAQCTRLVVGTPFGRLLAALGVVLVGAAALSALRARVTRTSALRLTAALVAALTLCAALVVVGLPARLLLPANWDAFGSYLHRGMPASARRRALPRPRHRHRVRLTAMLGATALMAIAAAIAFWPAGHRRRGRIVGLALLRIRCFGFAATLDAPAGELLWGALLLVLIVLWLWLPRLSAGQASATTASAVAAALVALPIAARLGDSGGGTGELEPVRPRAHHPIRLGPGCGVSSGRESRDFAAQRPQRAVALLESHQPRPVRRLQVGAGATG